MAFGPVGGASLSSLDISAPGAPSLSMVQDSNSAGTVTIVPPTVDADGSPITGRTFAQLATFEGPSEDLAVYVENFELALSQPGVQVENVDVESGDPVDVEFDLVPNRNYLSVARVADHPLSVE